MFRGNHPTRIDSQLRVQIHSDFVRTYFKMNQGGALPPLAMVPELDRISLVPANILPEFFASEEDAPDYWYDSEVPRIFERLSVLGIAASPSLYKTASSDVRMKQVSTLLEAESAKNQELIDSLGGKEYERFLKEVFGVFGFDVQLNVGLLGADVDLLLLESQKGQVPRFTIVECKHYAKSRKVVTLSQVLRLYGLRKALDNALCAPQALLVSSTGFTKPARNFGAAHGIGLVEYRRLKDWLLQNHALQTESHRPLLGVREIDSRGRLKLTGSMVSYLDSGRGRAVTVHGDLNHMQLIDIQELLSERGSRF